MQLGLTRRIIKIKYQHTSLPIFKSSSNTSLDEEVDLIAVFQILWKSRQLLVMSICCFALIGLLISTLLPQQWTSKAVVTAPEPTQWSQLQERLAKLQVLGIEAGINRNEVFNLFLKKFQSEQEREEFIKNSPRLMTNLSKSSGDSKDLQRVIVAVSEKIQAVNDNASIKESSQPFYSWTLSFAGPNPQIAQSILDGYIKFVTAKVVAQTIVSIRDSVALKVQTEKDALMLERVRLENIKETKIKRLSYSLEVAKAAGIIRPVYSNGQVVKDDPDFSIALGAKGIARKLEIEKSINDISELDSSLRNREYQLSLMEKISITNMTFPVFKYQMSPSRPVKKDSPGKLIVVILTVLLGCGGTCAGILLSHALAQRSFKETS
ncbi:LPS O-antigen length regulator Wzz(fepE) [Enterobacter kobei]|uniref:LPS O-antigen length regulator Wzz(fepE) n=1 Tax=Enterobacter kobei TaxID=208224 RepID=UPI003CEA41E6